MFDGKAFGQEVVAAVKFHLDKSVAPLLLRVEAVERRLAGIVAEDADNLQAIKGDIESVRKALAELPKPKDGKDGAPGNSVTVEDVGPLIVGEVAKAVSSISVKDGRDGKDGAPGLNGKDADPAMVASLVVSEVKAAVAAMPAAKDGVNGKDGINGKDGSPGRDGVDGKDGSAGRDGKDGTDGASIDINDCREFIREELQKAVAALPRPEKGEKGDPGVAGKDGRDGVDGKDGANGLDGKDGRDGVGAAGALIDRSGNLVLTLTDGTQRELGVVVGKDGANGRDGRDGTDGGSGPHGQDGTNGRDGIDGKNGVDGVNGKDGVDGKDGINGKDGNDGVGFDDIEESIEDEGRFIVRRFIRNGIAVAERRHQTKMPIWRGVFDVKRAYLPGDMATWKGSLWHCNAEVEGKIGSEHWSLAVKKGRDAPEPNS